MLAFIRYAVGDVHRYSDNDRPAESLEPNDVELGVEGWDAAALEVPD